MDRGITNFMARQLPKVTALAVFTVSGCSSYDPANNQVVYNGLINTTSPQPGVTVISPGAIGFGTNVAEGADSCSGAAGSVVPPLAPECTAMAIAAPLAVVDAFNQAIYHNEQTIRLNGLERFWVKQTSENTCWAAALETARAYLRLQPISQEAIYEGLASACPILRGQRNGASMYQIATAIRQSARRFDGNAVDPHFCNDTPCILHYLLRRRPVLALNGGHVVLIAGMNYTAPMNPSAPIPGSLTPVAAPDYNATRIMTPNAAPATNMPSKFTVVARKYFILDPDGDGRIEERDPLALCRSDAFIAL